MSLLFVCSRWQVFKKYRRAVNSQHCESHIGANAWSAVVAALDVPLLSPMSWTDIKVAYDMRAGDVSEEWDRERDALHALSAEAAKAYRVDKEEPESESEPDQSDEEEGEVGAPHEGSGHADRSIPILPKSPPPPLNAIEFTQAVARWLERADAKYRALFCRRIEQLADGQRSYALSKPLRHCVYPVFETKLDAGKRLIWTRTKRGGARESLLVWFVSKHDHVSHYVKLVERTCSRLDAPISGLWSVDEEAKEPMSPLLLLGEDTVLLDPTSNVPLKVFSTPRKDFSMLSRIGTDWQPSLLLSAKEREVNDQEGTVCVIGRSGTGKTVCLCDRMLRDRQMTGVRNQLFVSRSKRLCEFVRAYYQQRLLTTPTPVEEKATDEESESVLPQRVDFFTLEKFIREMDRTITVVSAATPSPSDPAVARTGDDLDTGSGVDTAPQAVVVAEQWWPSRRLDFKRFRDSIFPEISQSKSKRSGKAWQRNSSDEGGGGLDPLVVWTQIRSFIKGSIEAALQHHPLTLDQYLDTEAFGKDRSRLSPDQRREVYHLYTRYDEVRRERGLWDDADQVAALLHRSRLQHTAIAAPYDRVYVDEVQDCTQAEIALYFVAAGLDMRALFFAGDPAQSVVEGVDFRFEEIRSVVHKLSAGKESIVRPLRLLVNYRSHAGVLDCASLVLEKMFGVFPGAAKVLPSDPNQLKPSLILTLNYTHHPKPDLAARRGAVSRSPAGCHGWRRSGGGISSSTDTQRTPGCSVCGRAVGDGRIGAAAMGRG